MMLVAEAIPRERIEYSNGAFETVFGNAYAYASIIRNIEYSIVRPLDQQND